MYVTKDLCDEKEAHTTQFFFKTAIDLIIHTSHGLWLTRLLCPWNSPGKNTGADSHSLLQGNLLDPGIEVGSPALQAGSLLSEPPGKPRVSCSDFNKIFIKLLERVFCYILKL